MEEDVLAALLDSREAYEALAGRLSKKDFSEQGQVILKEIFAYYKQDSEATNVSRSTLRQRLRTTLPTEKQTNALVEYLRTVPASDSPTNVAALYKDLRRYNLGCKLAEQYVLGDYGPETARLQAQMDKLDTEEIENWCPLLTVDDIFDTSRGNKIRFYPRRANEVLNGGPRPGHTILIFGRPGSGKTAVAVNAVAGMLNKGHTVLYAGNEESQDTLQMRFLSRMGNMRLDRMDQVDMGKSRKAAKVAEKRAKNRGYDRLHIAHGNMPLDQLEAYVKKVKPDVLVVDQLQHIDGAKENRTRTMENTMRTLRDWAHEYQMVVIAVTQAGMSADGKAVLQLTDIDFANTGVQGACDVMVGVGFDAQMQRTNKRCLSFCRNKVSGKEVTIPVWLDKQHTAIRNRPVGVDQ